MPRLPVSVVHVPLCDTEWINELWEAESAMLLIQVSGGCVAEGYAHSPSEIGVFELLTITSAASAIGMTLRLPVGGVGRLFGPGEGAENNLASGDFTGRGEMLYRPQWPDGAQC